MSVAQDGSPLEEQFFEIDAVRLERRYPELKLLTIFRIATHWRLLLIAWLAVVLQSAGLQHIDQRTGVGEAHPWPWDATYWPTLPATELTGDEIDKISQQPLSMLRDACSNQVAVWRPVRDVYRQARRGCSGSGTLALRLGHFLKLLWGLLVCGVFGGMICRLAAVEAVLSQRESLSSAARFAARRILDTLYAPWLFLIGIGMLWGLNRLIGTTADIPGIGAPVASLAWGVALLLGLALTMLLLVAGGAWPLMVSAMAVEDADGFDAFSRSLCYVLNRPVYGLSLAFAASLIGSILMYAVSLILLQAQRLTEFTTALDPDALHPHLMTFWNRAYAALPAAVLFSFFWTAITIIYLLLRYREDGTPLDAIGGVGRPSEPGSLPLVGIPAAVHREAALTAPSP